MQSCAFDQIHICVRVHLFVCASVTFMSSAGVFCLPPNKNDMFAATWVYPLHLPIAIWFQHLDQYIASIF